MQELSRPLKTRTHLVVVLVVHLVPEGDVPVLLGGVLVAA